MGFASTSKKPHLLKRAHFCHFYSLVIQDMRLILWCSRIPLRPRIGGSPSSSSEARSTIWSGMWPWSLWPGLCAQALVHGQEKWLWHLATAQSQSHVPGLCSCRATRLKSYPNQRRCAGRRPRQQTAWGYRAIRRHIHVTFTIQLRHATSLETRSEELKDNCLVVSWSRAE